MEQNNDHTRIKHKIRFRSSYKCSTMSVIYLDRKYAILTEATKFAIRSFSVTRITSAATEIDLLKIDELRNEEDEALRTMKEY